MSEPTPGPWKILRQRDQFWVHGANKLAICEIVRWTPGVDEADARLVAAAPDMLSLLKELIDIEGPQPGTNAWAEKVRAAIAKVEGRDV